MSPSGSSTHLHFFPSRPKKKTFKKLIGKMQELSDAFEIQSEGKAEMVIVFNDINANLVAMEKLDKDMRMLAAQVVHHKSKLISGKFDDYLLDRFE